MPYRIRRSDSKWVVYNKASGDVKGTHDTRRKAMKQMHLLYGVESGKWHPTKS